MLRAESRGSRVLIFDMVYRSKRNKHTSAHRSQRTRVDSAYRTDIVRLQAGLSCGCYIVYANQKELIVARPRCRIFRGTRAAPISQPQQRKNRHAQGEKPPRARSPVAVRASGSAQPRLRARSRAHKIKKPGPRGDARRLRSAEPESGVRRGRETNYSYM